MERSLSIIVPAYNEATRLGKTLLTIIEYLEKHYSDSEIIIVDDGSSDDTLQVVEQYIRNQSRIEARIIPVRPNQGKGHAVQIGLLAARSPVALFTDADLSTPITEIPKLVEPVFDDECDLIFGSRALDRRLIGVHQPWRREQGGRVFNLLVRLATGLPFWDTQCGFKAFRMSVCQPIIKASTIQRFGFDVELLYVAFQAGLRMREVPVQWDHNSGSKVSVLRDSLRMFNEVRIIRSQSRRGAYDAAIQLSRDQAAMESEQAIKPPIIEASLEVEMKTDLADAAR